MEHRIHRRRVSKLRRIVVQRYMEVRTIKETTLSVIPLTALESPPLLLDPVGMGYAGVSSGYPPCGDVICSAKGNLDI